MSTHAPIRAPNVSDQNGVTADFSGGPLKTRVPERSEDQPKAKKIQITALWPHPVRVAVGPREEGAIHHSYSR